MPCSFSSALKRILSISYFSPAFSVYSAFHLGKLFGLLSRVGIWRSRIKRCAVSGPIIYYVNVKPLCYIIIWKWKNTKAVCNCDPSTKHQYLSQTPKMSHSSTFIQLMKSCFADIWARLQTAVAKSLKQASLPGSSRPKNSLGDRQLTIHQLSFYGR